MKEARYRTAEDHSEEKDAVLPAENVGEQEEAYRVQEVEYQVRPEKKKVDQLKKGISLAKGRSSATISEGSVSTNVERIALTRR